MSTGRSEYNFPLNEDSFFKPDSFKGAVFFALIFALSASEPAKQRMVLTL